MINFRKNNKSIIIVLLMLLEIGASFFAYKSFSYRNNELDEVNMLGKNSGLFAIYIKEGGQTEYTRSNNDEFPSGYYELNTIRSGCIDNAGNSLENVTITYEEGEVEVKTNQSVYCYLYFDFNLTADKLEYDNHEELYTECTDAQCAIDELYAGIDEKINGLKLGISNELVAGLYRYQGILADNYICFGTTDKDTCLSDTDKYMYRIIGNTSNDDGPNNQMKLIKKEALNTAYAWHSDRTTNTTWPNSDLFDGLNGSYFLTNTNYVPSNWETRIAMTTWTYGDLTSGSANAVNIATTEQGFNTTVNAKIGLMYLHDYIYAMPGGNNCTGSGSTLICNTSWIYLLKTGNDPNAPAFGYEWTMTRYDKTLFYYQTWKLRTDTLTAETSQVYDLYLVRPVFYLTSSQVIASGDGTIDNPFILS